MDSTFRHLRNESDDCLAAIFMDDVSISTEGYEGDSDDDVVNRHIDHCCRFLEAAKEKGIQFKMEKCLWGVLEIPLLGFVLGNGTRRVDPAKVETVRQWPQPRCLEDIISFRAFVNFLREFVPELADHDRFLRPYTKKGAKFADFERDQKAQAAFKALKEAVCEDALLHVPDYEAAGDPKSGRPFELYIDTSDYA